jgi:hypothetical protein
MYRGENVPLQRHMDALRALLSSLTDLSTNKVTHSQMILDGFRKGAGKCISVVDLLKKKDRRSWGSF